MNVLTEIHGSYVFPRRINKLVGHLANLLPEGVTVLDVGGGDGLFARSLLEQRPDLTLRGIDVLVREVTHIPVERFDGTKIPSESGSYDVVMFVDVLHHIEDPMPLLKE